jgi:hypothetical protein
MNAYRSDRGPRHDPPESRWAYWRHKARWSWENIKPHAAALAVMGGAVAFLAIAFWFASIAIEAADERERERMLGPCRDAVVSRMCPHPAQRLTIEAGLVVCRCETLSRATGDK